MYIGRIRLNKEVSTSPKIWSMLSSGYENHKMIWKLFPGDSDQRRDFLFRRDNQGGDTIFYTVSERIPSDSSGLWIIEHKPYHPKIVKGLPLRFLLRANPVCSRKNSNGKHKRHDVVMDAKYSLKKNGSLKDDWPPVNEIAQTTGFDWLQSRCINNGFEIVDEKVVADGYHQHTFFKKGRKIKISTLEFTGLLKVIDPERFLKMLYSGIGPAKSFGCGLMLVKKV